MRNDEPEFTVTNPEKVLSVAPDALVSVLLPLSVVAPDIIIAKLCSVVVPPVTLSVGNVYAPPIADVPLVLKVVFPLKDTDPPAPDIVPVRLNVEAPELLNFACASVAAKVIPAVVVNVDPVAKARVLSLPEVALPVIVIPAVEKFPDTPCPTVIVFEPVVPAAAIEVVPVTVNVTLSFIRSDVAAVEAAKVSDATE